MVMLSPEANAVIYLVFDERGRPLGRVERPLDSAILGRSRGTVLLRRHLPPPPAPDSARRL